MVTDWDMSSLDSDLDIPATNTANTANEKLADTQAAAKYYSSSVNDYNEKSDYAPPPVRSQVVTNTNGNTSSLSLANGHAADKIRSKKEKPAITGFGSTIRPVNDSTTALPTPTGNDTPNNASRVFSNSSQPRGRRSSQLVRRVTRSNASNISTTALDEVPTDEDASRWAERIKRNRVLSDQKKREAEEDEDRVVRGTKVDETHSNFETAYNMLTGIRFCVSKNKSPHRQLTSADFTEEAKLAFDTLGTELTPATRYDFKFKDYAPQVFQQLRDVFKINTGDYLMSLTEKYILSEMGSPGKSGSFFYFSRDYKYIIKTVHQHEAKFLRKILPEYYAYVTENPNTLLSQFYGLHRVKMPFGRKIHFVVMNNLFPPHKDIHRTFDLKGSTIGREYNENLLAANPAATLKDLNWVKRNMHLEFGPLKKHALVQQMEKDVALLQKLKIMDYSLLVGIHDLERGNEENLRNKQLKVFQPGGEKEPDEAEPSIAMPTPTNVMSRTPSRMESAKKAKELRALVKNERPIPIAQTQSGMPNRMLQADHKAHFPFYSDEGGLRATHEDNRAGEEIYYLGIIDCLTQYGMTKKAEHFFKSLAKPEGELSAVPPQRYGDRFLRFMKQTIMTREKAGPMEI